ncbi:MAG: HPr family phosphocarrier protein [Lachnospiraceae bacterium]|nr:HPr family phosphocarrier protein [Lachnospiraceae bacterium]
MVNQSVVVVESEGLHLRPAGQFVRLARKFQSEITIRTGNKSLNGKQVVSILSGNIGKGDRIKIYCDGEDEDEALEALVRQIENGEGIN